VRTAVLTAAALVAFAGNSILCRMALGQAAIDPASYSTIRVIAGACTLVAITTGIGRGGQRLQGSWTSAFILFVYAVPFSFAYVRLTTGTGALVLFGSVQVTMLVAAVAGGERPHPRQWIGLALAVAGLAYLVAPGLTAPSLSGASLMALAGVSWGIYSLRGRSAADPLAQNAGNFARAIPFVIAASVLLLGQRHIEMTGALLAVVSGALASGLGYVAWYAALRAISTTRAALVQLPVPVLSAVGGLLLLGEPLSFRLVLSSVVVLGGVGMALAATERVAPGPSTTGRP
jgi:drug/metabolite transporter (DMT)-like permease